MPGRNNKAQMPRRKRGSGRGALIVIGTLFCVSALVRLSDVAGPAIAREVSALTRPQETQMEAAQCEPPPDIAAILSALKLREDTLLAREEELQSMEQALKLADQAFRQNMAALQQAEEDLAATIATSAAASENDLTRLTAVYENMKPKDAAGLFEQMAPEFAAGFIGRMRPDAAAAVMTGLKPETAYSISVILAGRNANAPQE